MFTRKSLFSLLLLALCAATSVGAQHQHYVAFCSNDEGAAGHAFIAIGYEDPELGMTVYDGSWGKYPAPVVSDFETVTSIFGSVPGAIIDDALTKINNVFVVKATPKEYRKVKALIDAERSRPKDYSLTNNDCLSFSIRAARVFRRRIKLPARAWRYNFPDRYIRKLIDLNP